MSGSMEAPRSVFEIINDPNSIGATTKYVREVQV